MLRQYLVDKGASDQMDLYICKYELNCLASILHQIGNTLMLCQELGDMTVGETSSSRLGYLATPATIAGETVLILGKASQFLFFFWNFNLFTIYTFPTNNILKNYLIGI